MNNEYKKGFIEAIDGVLKIVKDAEKELKELEEYDPCRYDLKLIENAILGLKISFFENYYENEEEKEQDKRIFKEIETLREIGNREKDSHGIIITEEDVENESKLTPLQNNSYIDRVEVKIDNDPYPTK